MWKGGEQDAVAHAIERAEELTESCFLLSPTLMWVSKRLKVSPAAKYNETAMMKNSLRLASYVGGSAQDRG